MHFPPLWGDFIAESMLKTMQEYGVKRCFYGHIHGTYYAPATLEYNGLSLSLISSDFLDFVPKKIMLS